MATTQLANISERAGQVVLGAQSVNLTSVSDWNETYTLPAGFGDCFIMAVTLIVTSIQTPVAAGAMRGPSGLVLQAASGVVDDVVELGEWRRLAIAAVHSQKECLRPVLWRAEEVFNTQVFSEDTGAGNTADMRLIVRVARLRNQSAPVPGRTFTYPQG